jgi:putative membrane protein
MLWLKAFHIIFVVTWFAGLFYLPRLLVHHAEASEAVVRERLKLMQRRLLGITHIGGVLALGFGLATLGAFAQASSAYLQQGWLHAKLALVALLVAYHLILVRLVRQLSDRDCVRGRNWGTNERGLWVTDGCRAEFEVGAGYGNGNGYARSFRCESNDNRTRYCNVDTRYGVELVRQISRSSCIEGRSWGVSREGVWVSRGCRAEFAVGDRNNYGDRAPYRY